jgi:hypothetical protein
MKLKTLTTRLIFTKANNCQEREQIGLFNSSKSLFSFNIFIFANNLKKQTPNMKKDILLPLLILLILQSCSPKIRTNLSNTNFQSLEPNSKILILTEDETVPENSNFVGELKIGDTGFSSDCGYTKVMEEAKKEAMKSGANLIQLIEVIEPNFGSTCYRIKAKLYRNLNPDALSQIYEKRNLENESRLPQDANYAIVYFYRPKSDLGSLIGYKIKMNNDIEIGRCRNGEKFEYKITEFGKYEFWAKTESKASVIIDVQKGQEYFVRCGLNMGVAVGRPEMYLIDNKVGISEYESIKKN